jgi:hypothetical protein
MISYTMPIMSPLFLVLEVGKTSLIIQDSFLFPPTSTEPATFPALLTSTLKMEVACSSKTMGHAYHTTCHDPEDHSINVCETVLVCASSISEDLVSHVPSVW